MMTSRGFERSARRWMRAYPAWWRSRRGEEMLGVLEELADDGAPRVGLRTGLGLVRGGWATRWRARPPWPRYVLYRLGLARLPLPHRWWAAQDIAGRFYPQREMSFPFVMISALAALPYVWPASGPINLLAFLPGLAFLLTTFLPSWDRRIRRLAWEQKVMVRDSEGVVLDGAGRPVATSRVQQRRRAAASPGLMRTAVVLGFGVVALTAAAVLAPKRVASVSCTAEHGSWCFEQFIAVREPGVSVALVVWLTFAVVAGTLLAVRGARRVWRAIPVDQPHRELVVSRVPWRALSVSATFAAIAVGEVTGLLVQVAGTLAVMCVVGFGLVAGMIVGLRGRDDVDRWAGIDAWRATVLRSPVLWMDLPWREPMLPELIAEPDGSSQPGRSLA